MLTLIAVLLLGYLAGSFPTAILVGKLVRGRRTLMPDKYPGRHSQRRCQHQDQDDVEPHTERHERGL